MRWIFPAALLLAAACASSDAGESGDGGVLPGCVSDADCPLGLVCTNARCVDAAGLPPEEEAPVTFGRPVAVGSWLLVLSPEGNSVALLDADTLHLDSIPLPDEPIDLAPLPGADAVLILSRSGRALTYLEPATRTLHVQQLVREFARISIAPDGAHALLWNPDGTLPADGAEGILASIDTAALASGAPTPPIERAAGRRHTDLFFRSGSGDAVVIGKSEITILDLADPAAAPTRLELPPLHSEPTTREAVASVGGAFVLIRSLTSPDLLVLDVAARTLGTLTLPAPPSDLDLSADGLRAVAVLRSTSQIASFELPDAPTGVTLHDVQLPGTACETPFCTLPPGQAELSADGTKALLSTNVPGSEAFALLDLQTGTATTYDRLEKQLDRAILAPDGTTAVVIHRPQPDSTEADAYERAVDLAEGYTVVDLATGDRQLKLTGTLQPGEPVFAAGGAYAAVPLRGDEGVGVDAIDRRTLVTSTLPLASAPEFAGPLSVDPDGVWITQVHPAGRISFVDLATHSVRTVTGFALHGEIER